MLTCFSAYKVPAWKPTEEQPERRLVKTSNMKSCPSMEYEPAAYILPAQFSNAITVIFALLVLSSRRSGGTFLGSHADSLIGKKLRNRLLY